MSRDMKKIVFVDDEQMIRQSIVSLIDWQQLGFELVGEASNGQEALTVIEQTLPDVVITDIRMPIMDGLELSRAIKDIDPTIKILILSGHESFDYAQSAIRLNIHAYLLKPVSKADLEQVLMDISQTIDEERRNANDIFKVTKEYMQHLDALKRGYLIGLVTDMYQPHDEGRLRNIAELYQVKFNDDANAVITLTLLNEVIPQVNEAVTNASKDIIFNGELQWVAYTRTIREVCAKYTQVEVFRVNHTIVMLISDKADFFENELDVMLLEIQQTLVKLFDTHAVMGISQPINRLIDVKKAYRQAMNATNFARQTPETSWVYNSDIELNTSIPEANYEATSERIIMFANLGDVKNVQIEMTALYDSFCQTYLSNDEYYSLLVEIFMKIIRAYRQISSEVDNVLLNRLLDLMMNARSDYLAAMFKTFETNVLELTQVINTNRENTKETLTSKGIKLMRENFANPDFNQKELANMLHISPNYLSSLFSKESGKPFREHLIEIRLNHAQKLLLSTDKKLPEIAELCGYVDQHYFSYGFKKYFGKSPRQMRDEFNHK